MEKKVPALSDWRPIFIFPTTNKSFTNIAKDSIIDEYQHMHFFTFNTVLV